MASKKPGYLDSLGRLLGFATAGTSKLSGRLLATHDLTLQQWVPLTALWRSDSLVESELAAYCRMSPSALNRLLDRMEAKGLVKRSKDPADRRRNLVSLGARGHGLSHLVDFHRGINETLLEGFTDDEATQLSGLLERVIANMEQALEKPTG